MSGLSGSGRSRGVDADRALARGVREPPPPVRCCCRCCYHKGAPRRPDAGWGPITTQDIPQRHRRHEHPSQQQATTTSDARLRRKPNHASPGILTQGQGRAAWRRRSVGRSTRRGRWPLLVGRGRTSPRSARSLAQQRPHAQLPHAPTHVLSHSWPAARAKASSPTMRSAAQPAWEAAAAQRCLEPTVELARRWPLAEEESGGACPATTHRAARGPSLSNATAVRGSAPQEEAAPFAEHEDASSTCGVQHSEKHCAAAAKTVVQAPLAGRETRPAAAAVDLTRHCRAAGPAAPACLAAWRCHARMPQSVSWCHPPPAR